MHGLIRLQTLGKIKDTKLYEMKQQELRIGNWVNPEHPYQIDANTFQNVLNDSLDENAIPLTEEWLLKFGVESIYDFKIYNDDGDVFYYAVGCEYVHQLQNLYFALTGEELEIK